GSKPGPATCSRPRESNPRKIPANLRATAGSDKTTEDIHNPAMSSPRARRRLAAVLFLDIVGSTKLAAELGDRSGRMVLGCFREVVRRELKRHAGREQDTAGDGFFATFAEPAPALRCAATIVAAVQELGLDVRTGVHFGECEEIDGKLGGIAVHLA